MDDLSLPQLDPNRPRRCAVHVGQGPKEKCGVFGVWGVDRPARLAYYALYAQQHRGQESAGVAVSDGESLRGYTGMGLVPEVFSERILRELERAPERRGGLPVSLQSVPQRDGAADRPVAPAERNGRSAASAAAEPPGEARQAGRVMAAIGHNRYSTTGSSLACNAQPIIESFLGGQVAVAHNGNLINAAPLREAFERQGHIFHSSSDTEVVIHVLASPQQQESPDPVASTLRRLQGAYSMLFLFPDRIEAARDPWGWRPLVLGELPEGAPVVASETVALDAIGARFLREVEPGEIVTLSDQGVLSRRFAEPAEPLACCVFEHVYFANPASVLFGKSVQVVREQLGEALAHEAPVEADYVMPMPDSGRSAANGYARASGVPYREGIVPNRYVGRTFIRPTPSERVAAVRLKLNIVEEIVRGRRLIVVDDSIVRGTTTRAKMDQLRQAGAKEIHLRISCPPIRHPCYFGVDFAEAEQLIAHGRSVEEIREFLGVDSLHYLSLEGLLRCAATEQLPASHFCTACYSGRYPVDVEHPLAKGILERQQMVMFD